MCGSNRLSLPGKGAGWGPGGEGGTEGLRWPGGEKAGGAVPQVGDPRRACQLGGLPCVTPSPQETPLPGGRVRVGAALLIPAPLLMRQGVGLGYSCNLGLARTLLPILGLAVARRAVPAQAEVCSGLGPLVPDSFSSSILCGPGVREAEKSLPALPVPFQHVSTLQPPGCPAVTDGRPPHRCAPGWGSPTCPALPLASKCS